MPAEFDIVDVTPRAGFEHENEFVLASDRNEPMPGLLLTQTTMFLSSA